jgi:hypothetical protein
MWLFFVDFARYEMRTIFRTWAAVTGCSVLPTCFASASLMKVRTDARSAADFCISGPADHCVAGVVNLFGMESPGLTVSLELARRSDRWTID